MTDDSTDTLTPEEQDVALAGEFALGLTTGEDDTLARERARRDPLFAGLVAGWQERFAAMTDTIAPEAPRRRVRTKLMNRVFPPPHVPFFERVWVWKGLTVTALVLAGFFAMPTLRPETGPQVSAPIYAAELSAENSALQVIAVVDPARLGIALRQKGGAAPEGRVLELWAILPEQAPVSLGVLAEGMETHVALPPQYAEVLDQLTLAITDEPPGGAPGGNPSGTVQAVGAVSEI